MQQTKPTRAQLAAEWRAKGEAQAEARRKEATALAEIRTGDTETIFGRRIGPGEHPSTAPIGSRENVFGVEESQRLTRPWDAGD